MRAVKIGIRGYSYVRSESGEPLVTGIMQVCKDALFQSTRLAGFGLTGFLPLGFGALERGDCFCGLNNRCGGTLEDLGDFVFDFLDAFEEMFLLLCQAKQAAERMAGDWDPYCCEKATACRGWQYQLGERLLVPESKRGTNQEINFSI